MFQVQFIKSKNKKKKYDVILPNGKVVSFGSISHLDHLDEKRRNNFKNRFRKLYEKNKLNVESPIFWSWWCLW
jgi:hypothetical protein